MVDQTISQRASQAVLEHKADLARALVEREFARQRYGRVGRDKSLEDAGYHLSFLAQALALDNRAVFIDYVAWAKVLLVQRKVLSSDFAFHLECLAGVLQEFLPADEGSQAEDFVRVALRAMPTMPDEMPTFLRAGAPLSPLAHQYLEALRRGERHVASRLVLDSVDAGTSVKDIYLQVFEPVQHEIGRLWQANRITVAHEHYCTAATQLIMSQLYPKIFSAKRHDHRLLATCVSGDLHEIGVRMVADFFEMDGWDTFCIGASAPHASVIAALIEQRTDVLAVSAAISYHVEAVRELIRATRQHPATAGVVILTGGRPFNQIPELWRQIGADGCARNAEEAVALANRLMKNRSRATEGAA